MTLRLYFDEDTARAALVAGVRAREIDVVTAAEAGALGRSDTEQLELATADGRVLCSFNGRDFYRIHAEFLTDGKSHAGIVLAPQQRYSIGEHTRRLVQLATIRTAESMRDQVEFLSAWGAS